jgi:hypothetical protein
MREKAGGETPMSDPGERTQANPHPISGHRTPWEIAADEAGPIGQPDRDVNSQSASGAAAARSQHAKGPRRAAAPGKNRKRR